MKNTLTSLALAGTLILSLTGCEKRGTVTRDSFTNSQGSVNFDYSATPLTIYDWNQDGRADLIKPSNSGTTHPIFYDPTQLEDTPWKNLNEDPIARVMSADMVESATQALNSERDLQYRLTTNYFGK